MKILIAGGTGYIGRNLVRQLLINENEVICLIRETSDISLIPQGAKLELYKEYKDIYTILEEVCPSIVVNVAGFFVGEHQNDDVELLINGNISFPTIVVDAAVRAGCKKIVSTGSYWQYYCGQEYNPVNLYAAMKQAFDDILKYYCEAEKCSIVSLIMFDVYGEKDKRRKIINKKVVFKEK